MGFWAGIKYALNSSIGTPDFKPLDKILNESSYIVATDDVLYNIGNVEGEREKEKKFFEKTVAMNGVLRFSAEINGSRNYVKIYVNGAEITTLSGTSTGYSPVSYDINIARNDVLKLTYYAVSSGDYLENAKLCGMPTFAFHKGIFE